MYKTIVVPVDGSDLAARAVPVASWLAAGFGAELHLVTTTVAANVTDAADALRRAALRARPVPVRSDVVEHSFPVRGVLDTVRSDDEPLLCLSTRGTSGLHALLLGSTSDAIIRGAPGPLVLVGPECEPMATSRLRMLVCVDGSDDAERVLPVAARWATELGMDVEVVLVADAHQLASFRTSTETHVDRAAATLRTLGVEPVSRIEVSTTPSRAIVEVATSTHAAIIALATHGTGHLGTETLGHVATEVVRHAPVPVLVVPTDDA
jgi:nucleotide-binding universal stress UspA family protein